MDVDIVGTVAWSRARNPNSAVTGVELVATVRFPFSKC